MKTKQDQLRAKIDHPTEKMGFISPSGENGVHHNGVGLGSNTDEPQKLLDELLLSLLKPVRPSTKDKIIGLLADTEKKQKDKPEGVPISAKQAEAYVKELRLKDGGKSALLPMLVKVGLLDRRSVGNTFGGRASTYLTTSTGWINISKPLPKTEVRKNKAVQRIRQCDPIVNHLEWSCQFIKNPSLHGSCFSDPKLKQLQRILNGDKEPKVTVKRKRYFSHPFNVDKKVRRGYRFNADGGPNEPGIELDIKTALPCMIPQIIREQKRTSHELTVELAHFIGLLEDSDIYTELASTDTNRDEAKSAFNAILNGGNNPGLYAQIKHRFGLRFPLIWGRLQGLIKSKAFNEHAMRHLANALRPVFKELNEMEIPALLYTDCLHVPQSKAVEVTDILISGLSTYSGVNMRVAQKNAAPREEAEDKEPVPPDVIDPWHPWVPLTFRAAEELWHERFINEGRDFGYLARTFAAFLNHSEKDNTPKTKQRLEAFMQKTLPRRQETAAA